MKIANVESFENWNGESGVRWSADADRRDRVLATIGDALIDAARLRRGEHVLDVGCGCGATAIAAATRVTPGGSVVGLDLSAPMLSVARARASALAVENATFVQDDAQTFRSDSKFDAVMSRFGTMFFVDPIAAFSNIGQLTQPNGRLCMATWQPLTANEWLMIPGAVLLRYGSLPAGEPGAPGMFAQSEPDVVTKALERAGFENIALDASILPLTLGANADEATDYLAGSGIGRAVLETVPDAEKPAAVDAVRAALAEHADASGVRLNAAVWIIHATKSQATSRPEADVVTSAKRAK